MCSIGNDSAMDVDGDRGAIGDYDLTGSGEKTSDCGRHGLPAATNAERGNNSDAGNGNESGTDAEMGDYAPIEHSSDSQRPTKQNTASKMKTKKANRRGNRMPDENSDKAWSVLTFTNKVGIAGMEAFLRRPEFGVDVDAEFPPKALPDRPFRDKNGTPTSRGVAMALKCRDLHKSLIDAKAEDDSRQATVDQLIQESRVYHASELAGLDTQQTALARIHLQTIRNQATAEVNAAFGNNEQPAAQLSGLALGSDGRPLISAAVQHLVYSVVVTQIRGNRLRTIHVSEAGDQRFQIAADYAQLRSRLKYELQGTLRLEEGVDREATARKLLMQEFPQQL
ncbi:hypothetical protein SLS60_010836 [Paraconiothyrium brasiliense]|uniref:Uncharacterized protein n=1 Tax=Paraconiothyrium brasiliense TaxID=300254 RepID=A0ABR3QM45_9PLEO